MDHFGKLSWLILRLAHWSLCAGVFLLCAGCQAEAILIPRRFIEPPPHVEEPLPAVPPVATSYKPESPPEAPIPADQKQWISDLLANRSGQISLHDALLIAIDNSEVVRTVEGTTGFSSVGATQYDIPAVEERLRTEQSRFDPLLTTGYLGSRIDQPPNSYFGPGILYNPRQDEGNLFSSLSKPTVTGGSISAAYNPPLGYLYYPTGASGFNPAYSSQMIFSATQPLLKGAGSDVNMAPIRVARLKRDQSILDVKQAMLAQVRGIEEAYWDLQAATINLQAIDFLLPLLHEAVRIEEIRLENQIVTEGEVARSRMLENEFQQQRVRLVTEVTNKQFRLANLMGISRFDVAGFVPIDPPVRERLFVNAEHSLDIALHQRPDLIKQRLAVEIRDVGIRVARNQAQPQLDMQALWRTTGLGDRLDTALVQMSDFKFNDWSLGITYTIPIGLRGGRATLRASELDYARERAGLRQVIENTGYQLAQIARELDQAWNEYQLATERIEQTREWMAGAAVRFENPPPALPGPNQQSLLTVVLNDYQQAMRAYIDAVTSASETLARYNSLLARLEEAQGTLLEKRNINMFDPTAPIILAPPPTPMTNELPMPYPAPLPGFSSYRDARNPLTPMAPIAPPAPAGSDANLELQESLEELTP